MICTLSHSVSGSFQAAEAAQQVAEDWAAATALVVPAVEKAAQQVSGLLHGRQLVARKLPATHSGKVNRPHPHGEIGTVAMKAM